MGKLLFVLLLIYAAVVYHDRHRVPVDAVGGITIEENVPYVAVYGRQDCEFTRKMMSDLKQSSVDYRFFSVDDREVAQALHARMRQKGLDTSYYLLPVVEAGGDMRVRPDFSAVRASYQAHHVN